MKRLVFYVITIAVVLVIILSCAFMAMGAGRQAPATIPAEVQNIPANVQAEADPVLAESTPVAVVTINNGDQAGQETANSFAGNAASAGAAAAQSIDPYAMGSNLVESIQDIQNGNAPQISLDGINSIQQSIQNSVSGNAQPGAIVESLSSLEDIAKTAQAEYLSTTSADLYSTIILSVLAGVIFVLITLYYKNKEKNLAEASAAAGAGYMYPPSGNIPHSNGNQPSYSAPPNHGQGAAAMGAMGMGAAMGAAGAMGQNNQNQKQNYQYPYENAPQNGYSYPPVGNAPNYAYPPNQQQPPRQDTPPVNDNYNYPPRGNMPQAGNNVNYAYPPNVQPSNVNTAGYAHPPRGNMPSGNGGNSGGGPAYAPPENSSPDDDSAPSGGVNAENYEENDSMENNLYDDYIKQKYSENNSGSSYGQGAGPIGGNLGGNMGRSGRAGMNMDSAQGEISKEQAPDPYPYNVDAAPEQEQEASYESEPQHEERMQEQPQEPLYTQPQQPQYTQAQDFSYGQPIQQYETPQDNSGSGGFSAVPTTESILASAGRPTDGNWLDSPVQNEAPPPPLGMLLSKDDMAFPQTQSQPIQQPVQSKPEPPRQMETSAPQAGAPVYAPNTNAFYAPPQNVAPPPQNFNNYDYEKDVSRYTQQPGSHVNDVSRNTHVGNSMYKGQNGGNLSSQDQAMLDQIRSQPPYPEKTNSSRMARYKDKR